MHEKHHKHSFKNKKKYCVSFRFCTTKSYPTLFFPAPSDSRGLLVILFFISEELKPYLGISENPVKKRNLLSRIQFVLTRIRISAFCFRLYLSRNFEILKFCLMVFMETSLVLGNFHANMFPKLTQYIDINYGVHPITLHLTLYIGTYLIKT